MGILIATSSIRKVGVRSVICRFTHIMLASSVQDCGFEEAEDVCNSVTEIARAGYRMDSYVGVGHDEFDTVTVR